MKPKAPAPTPVPTLDPAMSEQAVTPTESDTELKKKRQIRAGKSGLTVGLGNTSGINVDTTKQSGLSVGGI